MNTRTNRSLAGPALLAFAMLFTGCDSDSSVSGPDNGSGDTTVSGFVTDDNAAKSAGSIEGAVVTAAELNAQGQLSTATGQATTDASGRYSLETSANSDLMVVTASKADFESKVLVDASSSSSPSAITMTAETHAEADVYTESRRQNQEEVTAADVAAYVDAEIASRIKANAETAARVAVAIGNAQRAEREYAKEEGVDDEEFNRAEAEDERSYREYQSAMTGQVSASAAVTARTRLETNVAKASINAGGSATTSAKARGSAKTAMRSFSASMDSATRFQLRKRAELLAAIASGAAIESQFQAEGSSRTSAAAQAAAQLEAEIRAASSESQIENSWGNFEGQIKALVAAELSVPTTLVDAAVSGTSTVQATLVANLLLASTVEAVVSAKSAYYSAAESSMAASLSASTKADFGSKVLVLASGH